MLDEEEWSLDYDLLSASVFSFGLLRLRPEDVRMTQDPQPKMLRRLFWFLGRMLIRARLPTAGLWFVFHSSTGSGTVSTASVLLSNDVAMMIAVPLLILCSERPLIEFVLCVIQKEIR